MILLIKLPVCYPIRDMLNVMFENQAVVCVYIKSVTTALLKNQMHNSFQHCFIGILTAKLCYIVPY